VLMMNLRLPKAQMVFESQREFLDDFFKRERDEKDDEKLTVRFLNTRCIRILTDVFELSHQNSKIENCRRSDHLGVNIRISKPTATLFNVQRDMKKSRNGLRMGMLFRLGEFTVRT
jgi:hypothetical protein